MQDLWHALEERTRAWHALQRQGLADAVWEDYVSIRFGRTGDPRALEYLYPYLNHARRDTRLRAVEVVARVFEGRGPRALDALDYFVRNPDALLRDRAVQVVGASIAGSPDYVILEVLAPYLNHRNQFIRKLAVVALGKAAAGQASELVLTEIQRVAREPGPRRDEVEMAVASVFAGHPTEQVYALVGRSEAPEKIDRDNAHAVAVLVRGASEEWYQRACQDIFEPRLHAEDGDGWRRDFLRRDGISALSRAAEGRGMQPLLKMLHLRTNRCTGHAILTCAPLLFAGANREVNRGPLMQLAREGDVHEQRIAAVCLGRLMMGAEDGHAVGLLTGLCGAKSKAVQAAALAGLGMATVSACDEKLRRLCMDRVGDEETATAALRALGMIFLGSGRCDAFQDIRAAARRYRSLPVRGRQYCKPLAACYRATGLVYLGTGLLEPVEFLLDVLAAPAAHRFDQYHWEAARALVMIEFSQAALGWPYILQA